MGASTNAIFGGVFFIRILSNVLDVLPVMLSFLQEKHQSSSPGSLMNLHRVFGWVFMAI